jgi:two-component system, LytTR family, sensor kinase
MLAAEHAQVRASPLAPRWWLYVTAGWTISALISAAQLQSMRVAMGDRMPWLTALVPTLVSSYLWVPLTMLALVAATHFPVRRGRLLQAVLVHGAGALFAVLMRMLAVVALNPWIGWYSAMPTVTQLFITSLNNNVVIYILLVGAGHAVHYAEAARVQQKLLGEAQLLVLKSQLQPHFLFNTLNTISAFVRADPATAERMLERLGRLLRHSLESGTAHEVSLRKELEALEPYLDIELTRFEDRLTIEQHIDEELLSARVPHFILQPIVENAIRHGIAPRSAPGRVVISARKDGPDVVIEISDDGAGPGAGLRRNGVGLRNTQDRLAHLYGPGERLILEPGPGGGTRVSLRVPGAHAVRDV